MWLVLCSRQRKSNLSQTEVLMEGIPREAGIDSKGHAPDAFPCSD